MKNYFKQLLLTASLVLCLGIQAIAQVANVQIIHNAADPAADTVDIYVNAGATPAIDDFAFRTATSFLELPAGVDLSVGVAPGNSTGPADIIASFDLGSLAEDENYVVMATGVLDPSSFDETANPGVIGFTLEILTPAQTSGTGGNVDFVAYHGSTDAPTVDVLANGGALVDDLSYGDFSSYFSVPAASYTLDVTPGGDNSTVVASYTADLSGLGGGSAVVFASGFLNPANNQDGAAFGLFAALADGTVVEFPAVVDPGTANVQVIHNSADPAAASVDIYIDGGLAIDDFAFRAATPFLELPAETAIEIGVAPGNSTGAGDIIATFPIAGLTADENYVVVATGVLDPSSFDETANPGVIGFTLEILTPAQTSGTGGNVDFVAYHGSTDAPTVDVLANGGALVDDLSYGDFSSYFSVPAASYTLDVTPGGDNSTVVASYTADLSGLGGGSAVVFASGFLNPANNQDGAAFGLFAALADGTVVEFPAAITCTGVESFSLVDADADTVISAYDPIMEGAVIDLTGLPTNLSVRANLCEDVSAGSVEFKLDGSGTRTQVENVVPYSLFGDTEGDYWAWNPSPEDGDSYSLTATVYSMRDREGTMSDAFTLNFSFVSSTPQFANVQVIHNSPDPAASAVDIYLDGALAIDDFAFRAATPFLQLPADVAIEIGVAPGNSTGAGDIIATFPIAGLEADENYVVMATGVLDPSAFDASTNSDIAFTLEILTPARTSGTDDNVDFVAYHGSTDAPVVDVLANGGSLIEDLAYGNFSDYFSVPAASYTLAVTPGNDNSVIVAEYIADLSGLGGGSAVVFASGFLAPTNNQDGAAFGLFAALADGTVVAFPLADCSLAIESFSLVDPETDEVIEGYEMISEGAVIDLASLPTHQPNIRANVCDDNEISSVRFELSGSQHRNSIENVVPYALFGDIEGDYNPWHPSPNGGDSYTLTATAYDHPNGNGEAGASTTLNFSFINSDARNRRFSVQNNARGLSEVTLLAYPNPASDFLRIRLNNQATNGVSIVKIFSLDGKQMMEQRVEENVDTELNVNTLDAGIYIIQVIGNDYQQQAKVIINK